TLCYPQCGRAPVPGLRPCFRLGLSGRVSTAPSTASSGCYPLSGPRPCATRTSGLSAPTHHRGPTNPASVGHDGPTMLLTEQLPDTAEPDALFDSFSTWVQAQGLTLYPAQADALIEIVSGSNVIVNTPTGSGKSLIAVGAHFAALANGQRSFYPPPTTAP